MAEKTEAVLDDKEVKDFMNHMDSRLKSIKDGKKEYTGLLSAIIYRDVMDHFEKEEGPDGEWTPWSTAYRNQMNAIGRGGNKILQFSGKLRNAFRPGNVKQTSKGLTWFNAARTSGGFPYAWFHNEGNPNADRSFMWASEEAMDDISEQTLRFLMEKGL